MQALTFYVCSDIHFDDLLPNWLFCLVLFLLGTKEIYVDVDDNGVISMIFECSEMKEGSQFVWYKNYQEITDASRLTIATQGGKYVSSMWLSPTHDSSKKLIFGMNIRIILSFSTCISNYLDFDFKIRID